MSSTPILFPSTSTFLPLQEFQCKFTWALIIGFQLSFMLGFGMGANDVANAFGTSVGSGAISLKMAYLLASVMETLGAVLVGYNVVDTLRSKVVDLSLYRDTPGELMLGQVASLGGCASWLLIATVFKLPVASSHSIVGAILGFTLMMRGTAGIHWSIVIQIAISWFISPVLSGLTSSFFYMIVDFAVLRRRNPLKCGLRILPVFYFLCFAFNSFMVVYQGSKVLGLSNIPFWMSLLISLGIGCIAALIFQFIVRPKVIKWISDTSDDPKFANHAKTHVLTVNQSEAELGSLEKIRNSLNTDNSSNEVIPYKNENTRHQPFDLSPKGLIKWFIPARDRQEDQQTLRLFSTIQVFTGCFAGFAHGAMDVSHTIAPLIALLAIYNQGNVEKHGESPLWMMFYGVSGTVVGFWALGHRVMKTIGKKMTEINPCSGFTIEFGAAVTVLIASKLGIPISTTHCLVGSVVFVGTIKSGEGIDWSVFRNIVFSWLVTLPVSALISAAIMFALDHIFLKTAV